MNNIHLDSQYVEDNRAMGAATFTYDMHVMRQNIPQYGGTFTEKWILVDGDATRISFGPSSAPPTPDPGVFSKLRQTSTGFVLEEAGPPEHIDRAGNFTYTFNSEGRLLSLRDPSGNVQSMEYGSDGLLTRVYDVSSGKDIRFVGSGGRITNVIENGGGVRRELTYSTGLLVTLDTFNKDNARIQGYEIRYNSRRLPTYLIQQLGYFETIITHDFVDSVANGESVPMANMSIPQGPSTQVKWNSRPVEGFAHRVIRNNASGQDIFYDFDEQFNIRRITYPTLTGASGPTVQQFSYDANRNRTMATDGVTTWNMEYAVNGMLTSLADNAGRSWTYTYSGTDLLSASDSLGVLYTLGYTNPLLPHSPTSWADAGGEVNGIAYNSFGQVSLLTPPSGAPTGQTSVLYEENPLSPAYGWVRQVTNGAGEVTRFDDYTPLGDIASVTTFPEPGVSSIARFSYDGLHRPTQWQHADGKTSRMRYFGPNLRYGTDENGIGTDYAFCICGKLLSVDKGRSWTLVETLNRDFHTTSFQDPRQFKTNYSYGLGGELTKTTYPDASTLQYRYDTSGRVRQEINGRGQARDIRYDAAGRVAGYAFPTTNLPGVNYAYSPDGQIQQMQDSIGTTRYTYWPSRRVKSVEYDYRVSGLRAVQLLEYAYYPDGSLSSLTWKSGKTVAGSWNYGYDGAGRIASVTNSFGEETTYAYDGEGKLLSQTNANDTVTEYDRNDARGWPTKITQVSSGTNFAEYALIYDNGVNTVGNLTRVTEAGGSAASYTYDYFYRMSGEMRTGANAYTRTLQYDHAGNVERVNNAAFGSYDGANKLTGVSGGRTSHDGDGNLTSVQGAGLALGRFFWDDRSKLLRQSQGVRTVSYEYDGLGRRISSQAGTSPKTFYIFHGDLLLGEVANGAPSAVYTWGADGLVSERLMGQGKSLEKSLWYHFGPQGETRQLTEASGAVVDTYGYTAYGLPLAATGGDANPFRYGGKYGYYSDGGPMGLMLCGARWYSPHLMRWLSRDPSGFDGGHNLFAYCNASPTLFYDNDGLEPKQHKSLNELIRNLNNGQDMPGVSDGPDTPIDRGIGKTRDIAKPGITECYENGPSGLLDAPDTWWGLLDVWSSLRSLGNFAKKANEAVPTVTPEELQARQRWRSGGQ